VKENWIEVADEGIDAREIVERIRERMARRRKDLALEAKDLVSIAKSLWEEKIGASDGDLVLGGRVPFWQKDCDIMPRDYAIKWRVPILGPIHALVRRIIDNEIRCYLMPSLEKQSYFNRQVLRALEELDRENARLRQEIQELKAERQDAGTPI